MKKKIIIGLTIYTFIFFLGGGYIIIVIEKASTTLYNLIKLHQIEIMREQLLINAKMVQSDLAFEHTRFARELDTVISNVILMSDRADKCLGCHHPEAITEKLADLKYHIQMYKDSLSRVLTIRADTNRLEAEDDKAFQIGQKLVNKLKAMTSMTKDRLEKKTQAAIEEINDTKAMLFILILAGPFLSVGLAIVFIKGFAKPFNVLLQATRKIKGGDLSFRIQGLKDEFGEMATSFNEMADSINEQMQKMQRAEQMTVVGEMAAGLVHEIKNPLAGIKGSMQVILEKGGVPEGDRLILSKVMEEVERIEDLMKSLLNFAKPSKPLLAPANMNDVLESTLSLSLYPSLAPNSPNAIEIVKEFDSLLPIILADPVQMQQVFLNLFMNAIQAMPKGGVLTVKTSSESGLTAGVKIEITDTGKGINEEIREKIFQPFFTTKHKGSGLGLAICKQFVEMHGGTISAEHNPEGGTIFRIMLPLTQDAAVAPGEAG